MGVFLSKSVTSLNPLPIGDVTLFQSFLDAVIFTPRVLINAMVELMKPTLDDVIVDQTAGTGGILIRAHQYIATHNDIESLN